VSGERILVPVSDSGGVRQTVEYAVSQALAGGDGTVRFVVVHPGGATDDTVPAQVEGARENAEQLLGRVSVWASEDAGDHADELTVETENLGLEQYLFGPEDLAAVLAEDTTAHDIDRIVLDPEYDPGIGAPLLRPLEAELARFDLTIEEAPISRRTRRLPLLVGSTPVQIGVLFLVSFLFYQVLAGTLAPFDLATGAISATIVSLSLSRVLFTQNPRPGSLLQAARLAVYVPYLLWEIIKANVAVARVILDPSLPIEPRMTRITPAVWGALPLTTLANSITLTPGTLTVRIDGRDLIVHTLVTGACEDLFEGGLERGVRFAFYGRKAMNTPSPRERGAAEVLQKPPSEKDGPSAENESRQDDELAADDGATTAADGEPSTGADGAEETGETGDER
jgi:multicomponent Na+:H+ antiporter subunit E